jgi:hypothetical protein
MDISFSNPRTVATQGTKVSQSAYLYFKGYPEQAC